MSAMDRITFKINGVEYSVGGEISSTVSLLDFIRNYAELRGTKYMCREAGCGACIVSAVKTPGGTPMAVNSCIVSVTSCHNWEVTTVEKVGNQFDGYNDIQKTLAEKNGTQCGYCTPGWVMSMYSLLQGKKDLTQLEIEKSFGSNICRCTGYRPILEAFKRFAKDSPEPITIQDIEDLKICSKSGKKCPKKGTCNGKKPCSNIDDDDVDDWCLVTRNDVNTSDVIAFTLKDGKKWYRVTKVAEICSILQKEGTSDYMLVGGNTKKGTIPIVEYPNLLIDISEVTDLKGYTVDQNLIIGGGNTLSELLDICKTLSTQEYFRYLSKFYDHLDLVAHIPVRNVGTIAGNLMIKYANNEFPSDLFLLFETVGADMTIMDRFGTTQIVSMQNFLKLDMKGKIIINVMLPPLNTDYSLVTYKIMNRAQSVLAVVNAGFLFKLYGENSTVVSCRIVYGHISSTFIRAEKTEAYLLQKNLFRNETLQGALSELSNELIVAENPTEPSASYKKQLALNLFYKALLTLSPANLIKTTFRTGAENIRDLRPVSKSTQTYVTDPTLWPLNKPIEKLEALIQCSGEAKYTEDIPTLPREVYCQFVLSTVAVGTISNIDATAALAITGVIAFYTATDIPGVNSYTPTGAPFNPTDEELLCNGTVKYYNQPIGIIVAESRAIAVRAAMLVTVTYTGVTTPIVDIKDAKAIASRNTLQAEVTATDKGTDVQTTLKGSHTIYAQYHMTMENLVCVTKPTEDGLEVHSATQWMDAAQVTTARALKVDQNSVDVHVKRLGGAYGIKVSRSLQIAVACNLVSLKLNRPCRFIQPLEDTMRSVGKRLPTNLDYEVAVDSTGKIQYLNYTIYQDNGYISNEQFYLLMSDSFYNCYDSSRWNYKCYCTLTDTPSNTWCRAPGTYESIAMAEFLMERLSYQLSLDPFDIRLINLNDTKYSDLRTIVADLKEKSEYATRKSAVTTFNTENRWKKRGLRVALLRWTPLGGQYLDVNVAILHADGTVIISHCGIEMGQGINTKAVQICAHLLNLSVDKIKVKGNNTNLTPNGWGTGGSLTSQSIGVAIQSCCEQLLAKLAPVKETMNNPTWEQLIAQAYTNGVDLQAHGFVTLTDTQEYDVFGAAVAEVEVDILTGEFEIIRVDLVEDVGQSVNPAVDIGQIEGAFIMGLGYNTCEKLVYDKSTGELLTNRTWYYPVPQARDIPQDFRVYFRPKSYSSAAFFGAKAVGEPPLCMAPVIQFALREAIVAAKADLNIPSTTWFDIDGPYTLEAICTSAGAKTEDLKFY